MDRRTNHSEVHLNHDQDHISSDQDHSNRDEDHSNRDEDHSNRDEDHSNRDEDHSDQDHSSSDDDDDTPTEYNPYYTRSVIDDDCSCENCCDRPPLPTQQERYEHHIKRLYEFLGDDWISEPLNYDFDHFIWMERKSLVLRLQKEYRYWLSKKELPMLRPQQAEMVEDKIADILRDMKGYMIPFEDVY